MREDIKKLNMYAANVFSSILAQNPDAISIVNRNRFIGKSFEIAKMMMRLEARKLTLSAEIPGVKFPDEGDNDGTWWAQEKLIGDIEKNLGLKADDADPFTLTGRLAAIKRALADQGKLPRGSKNAAEKRVEDAITSWVNEGFKSYTTHNVNETGHRIAFARWSRLDEDAKKMARVIRDIGRSAWKDEENFPQPVSFTADLARMAGKNMARFVNGGYIDTPSAASGWVKKSLLQAVGYFCPTGETIRRAQNIVDTAYPYRSNDED